MTMTDTSPAVETAPAVEQPGPGINRATEPTAFERLVGSGDHRLIGRVFILCSLVFLAAGAVVSALVDANTASDGSIFSSEVAQRLLMNEQVGLLLLGVLPLLLGIAIAVVPTQVGSPAVAFPRAAAASLWTWLGSALVFIVTVAADGSYGGGHLKAARLGNVAVGALMVALCLAAVCVAVTVLSLRPAGLGLDRVPFFAFSMLVTASILVLTIPASLAHVVVGHISRADGSALATSTFSGGVDWLFQPPAVFMLFIPVLGILADVVATAVGDRQRFRGLVLSLIGVAGLASYGAWAQGTVAQSTLLWAGFVLLAGLPLLGVGAAVADTLGRGKPKFMSPLAFVALALPIALIGAGIGAFRVVNSIGKGTLGDFNLAAVSLAQFRVVLGAAVIAALGGIFYWGRQIFGASLPEAAGKGLAGVVALGIALWGIPWLVVGLSNTDSNAFAAIAAVGAAIIVLVALGTLGAAVGPRRGGESDSADPWGGGGTLEWSDGPLAGPIESAYPVLDGKDAS